MRFLSGSCYVTFACIIIEWLFWSFVNYNRNISFANCDIMLRVTFLKKCCLMHNSDSYTFFQNNEFYCSFFAVNFVIIYRSIFNRIIIRSDLDTYNLPPKIG